MNTSRIKRPHPWKGHHYPWVRLVTLSVRGLTLNQVCDLGHAIERVAGTEAWTAGKGVTARAVAAYQEVFQREWARMKRLKAQHRRARRRRRV